MQNADELRVAVKALRERAGFSIRGIADLMGMSASGYSHYEQRIKEPYLPMKFAVPFAEALEARGIQRDEVFALAQPAGSVLSLEEDLPPFRDLDQGEPGKSTLVPVYDVHASAGGGAVNHEEPEVYSLAFPPAYLKRLTSSSPGNLAIISVKGESMEPTLLDDDIVLLDASKTNLSYDGLFVLRFDDALHVKRVGRAPKKGHVTIISDNKDLYPPMLMSSDEIEAVGKVLWYGRKV
ncbi:S24 family peptidase [Mameliella alba]|uniref:S24 family peptidase n=1 Tax=Mameliella alba TaxID=561184 RepID=UPI0013FD2FD8|nr:S24 family peptidase [Mameliella alba]